MKPHHIARDALLQRWPIARADEAGSTFSDRRVLVIGNGNCLTHQAPDIVLGERDVVVRFNAAPSLAHLPGRTNVLATSAPVSRGRLRAIAPDEMIWLPPSRHRLRLRWLFDRRFRLRANDPKRYRDLADRLGVDRPSSGASAIDLLVFALDVRPELYGFDGFVSGSIGREKPNDDTPHDFEREARWIEELDREGRLVWHRPEGTGIAE